MEWGAGSPPEVSLLRAKEVPPATITQNAELTSCSVSARGLGSVVALETAVGNISASSCCALAVMC